MPLIGRHCVPLFERLAAACFLDQPALLGDVVHPCSLLICSSPIDCSALALAISATMSVTRDRCTISFSAACGVGEVTPVSPAGAAGDEVLDVLAACADAVRATVDFRATTAKARPASPARAASTAAL